MSSDKQHLRFFFFLIWRHWIDLLLKWARQGKQGEILFSLYPGKITSLPFQLSPVDWIGKESIFSGKIYLPNSHVFVYVCVLARGDRFSRTRVVLFTVERGLRSSLKHLMLGKASFINDPKHLAVLSRVGYSGTVVWDPTIIIQQQVEASLLFTPLRNIHRK